MSRLEHTFDYNVVSASKYLRKSDCRIILLLRIEDHFLCNYKEKYSSQKSYEIAP